MSLKIKIALLTLFSALVVGMAGAAWSVWRMHDVLTQELSERGVSVGTALAETLGSQLIVRNHVGIIHGLRRLQKSSEDIQYLYVVDFEGKIFGHAFAGGFPDELAASRQTLQAGQEVLHRELVFQGKDIYEVTLPLFDSLSATITIGMDASILHGQLQRLGWLIVGVALGIGMLVSLFTSYIGNRLVAPIEGLAEQMSRYGRGENVVAEEIGNLRGSSETEALSQRFADMIRDRQYAEAELNQFKDTLDNTLDAVFMFNPDHLRFFYVNRGAVAQVGYSRKELLRMGPVDIKPLIDEQGFRELVAPLLSGKRASLTFETVHRSKDGRDIPVEVFLQYMSDPVSGRFLAIVRDISDRKQAETALRDEQNFTNAVLDNAAALIVVLDREGHIRRFNRACEIISQYDFREVEGRFVWDFLLLPEERDVIREQAFDALANNPQTLAGHHTNYWIAKDGTGRLIDWNNSLLLDERGEMEYMVSIGVDITERMQTEAELNQIKTSLDNTEDAVFMFFPDSLKFFYVNRGAQRQVGYSRDELLEMTAVDIKPFYNEEQFREMITPLISGELESATFETIHRNKSGHDIPVEIFLQFMADGKPPHFLAIVRDISERKRTEAKLQRLNRELEDRVKARTAELGSANDQLLETLDTLQQAQDELVRSEKLASLGSLVAGVAHELNTPLGNSVTLGSSMQEWQHEFKREMADGNLRKSSLNEFLRKSEEATNLLIRNLARAAELITDFKQVAVDQTSAQRRGFDLHRMVTEVIETLQPQFKKTPHRINVDIPEGIMMDSYPGPLGQVITNLTLNSLVHGFADIQRGLVIVHARALPDEMIELVVEDNGCGIPSDHLSKVFDPFFTTKLGKGGSGLGMHIVYTLVTRVLGGSIAIENTDTGGARLTIKLPCVAPQTKANAETTA